MAHLQARQHIFPDSGFPITPPSNRASFADPEKRALFAPVVKRINLTESIGTILEGVPIGQLSAYFDPASESRNERKAREKRDKEKEREKDKGDGVAAVETPA
ncbi:hypothetical protein BDW60DRAFT_202865 [Aspergillus nidulans var. acristatus]